ncbi:NADH-quinone oxidoreductase subunit N [Desulfacinum hydrothermale DSM 13146]|uniref:NADH-quinone oxidoreductase subunit N n=1 Tax=Desulfacinum hydrothermale DSM 13146 TaxID=1121390 RepID=A0A1W1X9X2_9BACT|nr:NADH-quinone oxidoreductase subunit N [Desulfacinum hydrothermale]SMC20331.1 NADH-quinone oxidoreductase subunit N [Desulfacinum hydrothermale DSM 13146]
MSVVEALYQCSGLLAVLVLFATGVLILLLDAFSPLGRKGRLGSVAVAGTVAAWFAAWQSRTTGEALFSQMVVWDRYALFVTSVILAGALLVLLLSLDFQRREGAETGEYHALVLFAATGMILMAQAVHFIMVFLGLEILSISIYVLVGLPRHERRANEAALKYVLLGGFASGFFLYGLTFLYGATGSLTMTGLTAYLGTGGPVFNTYLLLGTALVLVGFAFKLALVPFHLWTPDVYEGAPTPVTAYMAVGVKAAVLAALVRTFWEAIPAVAPHWNTALWILAAVTMTVGNVMALNQPSVKRMLAFSSIAHAGYLLVAVVAGSQSGVTALLVYLLAYTVMNVGAFGVMVVGQRKGVAGEALVDFEGLGFRSPFLGAAMALFVFSLAGIPPTAGFLGKLLVFSAAVEAGYTWLVIVAVINSVVAAYYYLRVVIAIYRRPQTAEAGSMEVIELSGGERAALILAGLLTLAVGVLPQHFWQMARHAALVLG